MIEVESDELNEKNSDDSRLIQFLEEIIGNKDQSNKLSEINIEKLRQIVNFLLNKDVANNNILEEIFLLILQQEFKKYENLESQYKTILNHKNEQIEHLNDQIKELSELNLKLAKKTIYIITEKKD